MKNVVLIFHNNLIINRIEGYAPVDLLVKIAAGKEYEFVKNNELCYSYEVYQI